MRQSSAAPSLPQKTNVQRLTFSSISGENVRAFYLHPKGSLPKPAILYIHAHGGRYDIGADELMDGRPALKGPFGPVLANMGFAVLCIDLPSFGERAQVLESALAKKPFWYGGSMAGQMTGELHLAYRWLSNKAA